MRNFLKIIGGLTAGILATLVVGCVAFVNLSPEFGHAPAKARRPVFVQSGHYQDGTFHNPLPTPMMTGGSQWSAFWSTLTARDPQAYPAAPLPMQRLDSLTITRKTPDMVRVTWFGHSASLVEIAGKNILLDPMLSIKMGPLPGAGPVRYNPEVPITAAKLPFIDAVLISHDHYDHLDYQTIRQIKGKVGHFYVPLGVGAHLLAWGVAPAHITEMTWGDSASLPGLTIISQPTRHFSGRNLTNRDETFWSSWVMKSATKRLFFSGDGGYGPHFKAIGAQYGPFDLALMECGQYDKQWAFIHMQPEQSVQAALDVRARAMLPVHWGAFTEALHAWNDPVKRASAAAARQHLPLTTPELGQPVVLGAGALPQQAWWQ